MEGVLTYPVTNSCLVMTQIMMQVFIADKLILDNIYTNKRQTEFSIENNRAKLIQGIQLQGHGGAFYTKAQLLRIQNKLDK